MGQGLNGVLFDPSTLVLWIYVIVTSHSDVIETIEEGKCVGEGAIIEEIPSEVTVNVCRLVSY